MWSETVGESVMQFSHFITGLKVLFRKAVAIQGHLNYLLFSLLMTHGHIMWLSYQAFSYFYFFTRFMASGSDLQELTESSKSLLPSGLL